MRFDFITELLGLQGFSVYHAIIKENILHLYLEREELPICPQCGSIFSGEIKDTYEQCVEDLSVFGKRCYIIFDKVRFDCQCSYAGNELIPWLCPYARYTIRFTKWIYAFCKRMAGIDVARIFGISKHAVYRLDKAGIEEELSQQEPIKPSMLSIDEISRKKGHRYATIISAPRERKIVEVIKDRKKAGLNAFFKTKGKVWCSRILIVTMDAWKAFRTSVSEFCQNAAICFDHFHLAQHFSKAIDKIRNHEAHKASKKDKEVYVGKRWLLLRKPENLDEDQKKELNSLLDLNKNIARVYILRDEFREIFYGFSVRSRLIRLANWMKKCSTLHLKPLTDFVKMIRRQLPYVKNSLRNNVSNGFAEGLNNKIRVIQRMAYGYKDFDYLRLKIIQQFNFRSIKSLFDP